jgi:hypothetical protein
MPEAPPVTIARLLKVTSPTSSAVDVRPEEVMMQGRIFIITSNHWSASGAPHEDQRCRQISGVPPTAGKFRLAG